VTVSDATSAWPSDPASVGTGLPLEGVRVLDLSKILAGPLCVLVVADLGADVIKVEAPDHGDGIRAFAPPSFGTDATYYLSVNRNRRSIAVDLAAPQGRATVAALARAADAVVENFLPHQLVSLELDQLRAGGETVIDEYGKLGSAGCRPQRRDEHHGDLGELAHHPAKRQQSRAVSPMKIVEGDEHRPTIRGHLNHVDDLLDRPELKLVDGELARLGRHLTSEKAAERSPPRIR